MNNAIRDIKQEIYELNNSRSQNIKIQNENKKLLRKYFHQRVLLEGKFDALEEINDNLMKRIDKAQNLMNNIVNGENYNFPDNDLVLRRIRNASHYFKSSFLPSKQKDSSMLNSKISKL